MTREQTPEAKLRKMIETPIPKLVLTLSAPTIVSMLISALYNMADTYFVGLMGNPSATAAVGVCFPLMAILQAVGFMFGHGSGNYISRALGAKDHENATRMSATGFFSSLLSGVVIMALGLVFLQPLVMGLGSTVTMAPFALDYARYILIGSPWLVASLVLNNQLRFQGNAFFAMIGVVVGTVINIALDPLFIFALGMGVGGAALATILSQLVSFCLLLLGTRQGGNIRIRFNQFTPSRVMFREIFRGGVPSLLRQGLASLATVALNFAAGGFGDTAVAAISIVTRVMQFAVSAVIGFGQGFQPICGFNYGAKRYDRVRGSFWFSVKLSFGVLLGAALIGLLFAPGIVEVFLRGNAEVTRIGALSLRLQCITLPLTGFLILSNMMLQTMGMAREASLVAVSRQGLFFLPAIFLLPPLLGLFGVQLSQPVSDLCSLAMTAPLTLRVLKDLKRKEARLAVEGDAAHAHVPV
ncbi:MAG TPA: MATE family efflux transporter [Candidatus Limiplasma sp.]|nr:MATE family efflux transporter [Candidatus Limiplasma sp.]